MVLGKLFLVLVWVLVILIVLGVLVMLLVFFNLAWERVTASIVGGMDARVERSPWRHASR